MKRLEDVLDKRASTFAASIIQLVNGNTALQRCDPTSVIGACLTAATHNLSIHPSLGHAHIVPFKGNATFILGYKGMIQLAQRTGEYGGMGAIPIFENQLTSFDPLFGGYELDESVNKKGDPVGYLAAFKLKNGFLKSEYMTRAEVERHAVRFSQSFSRDSSPWKTDFDAMAIKTVLRRLLTRWGYMTIDMERAITDDTTVRTDLDAEPSNPGILEDHERQALDDDSEKGIESLGPANTEKPEPTKKTKTKKDKEEIL